MFQFAAYEVPAGTDKKVLEKIAESLEEISLSWWVQKHSGTIGLAVIDDARMQELNREYRGIDSNTDVLSFHYFEDFSDKASDEIVGEIVFSESKLLSQAEEFSHSLEEELYRLVVHGTIHILGFDHETDEEYEEMNKVEWEVLENIWWKNSK